LAWAVEEAEVEEYGGLKIKLNSEETLQQENGGE
jgi:hypothetical protein